MTDEGYVHGSYGYLLYLMKRYDEANKHLDISLNANDLEQNYPAWRFFYYGLLQLELGNKQKSDEYLEKAAQHSYCDMLDHLKVMKEQDPKHIDYIMKLEHRLKQKPKSS